VADKSSGQAAQCHMHGGGGDTSFLPAPIKLLATVESLTAGMLYTPKTKAKPYDNAADRLFLVPFEEFV
jgi:hypothetical protein